MNETALEILPRSLYANQPRSAMPNEWRSPKHALEYLRRADRVPHRTEGEATLLAEVPASATRLLDLGAGGGRLLDLLLAHCPSATGVALDFSPLMLEQLRCKYGSGQRVQIVEHNLDQPLPDLGTFDVVASSFAIHHVTHERKRALYQEIWHCLRPGGVFANLEHVSSPTAAIHQRFLEAFGITPEEEDPSNILLDVETQLSWLRDIGFVEVDCFWKWRELALLVGRKTGAA
jgi:tRNA (cmo5U34)-methyltransferase